MRILHTVETYNPYTSGMQEVVQRISELLVKDGHQVTVATTAMPERTFTELHGVTIRQFDIQGNGVLGYRGNPADIVNYQNLLLSGEFDVITGFAAQQWSVDLMLPLLGKISAATVFVPTGFSGLHWRAYKKYYQQMPTWLRDFDANILITQDYRDAQYTQAVGIHNTYFIPNGASVAEFTPPSTIDIRKKLVIPDDHLLILHVGSHTGVKGHAEMIKSFLRADLPPTTLVMIGTNPPNGCSIRCRRLAKYGLHLNTLLRRGKKQIKIVTLDRTETVAAFQAADIFLFLSNIECAPIVLFESMASATPFISTNAGNANELANENGGTGIIVKTRIDRKGNSHANINSAKRALELLAHNPKQREALGQAGHTIWNKKYTWEGVARKYATLYTELLHKNTLPG